MTFKYILIGLLGTFLLYLLVLPRSSVFRKGFIFVFVLTMLTFAIKPEWSATLAQHVGVARGVDLLFYLSHLVLFFIAFVYYMKFKEMELRFTKLVRKLAIEAAPRSESINQDLLSR
jgi:hypothetical protein